MTKADRLPDFHKLFERGYELAEADDNGEWHSEPSVDEYSSGEPRWHWHASSIGGCVRAQILKRAGMAPDAATVDSEMAFAFGHTIHSAMEGFLLHSDKILEEITEGEWRVHSVETGGAHPTLPLKAKPDAVLVHRHGALAVMDTKTEGGSALRIRKEKLKTDDGKDGGVSLAHKLQVTAGAMCTEARGRLPEIKTGIMCYVSRKEGKNSWDFYREQFAITPALRKDVLARLDDLDTAWFNYESFGALPPRLEAEKQFYGGVGPNWRCRARSNDDPRGKFCASRSVCMALPPEPLAAQLGTIK